VEGKWEFARMEWQTRLCPQVIKSFETGFSIERETSFLEVKMKELNQVEDLDKIKKRLLGKYCSSISKFGNQFQE
jgi:hypothetical protein